MEMYALTHLSLGLTLGKASCEASLVSLLFVHQTLLLAEKRAVNQGLVLPEPQEQRLTKEALVILL